METKSYTLTFGILEITGRMISATQREEKFIANEGHIVTEWCHCVDEKDNSPRVETFSRRSENFRHYNPICSCCYLGFNHFTALHDKNIGE